jgi:hypothetical protein
MIKTYFKIKCIFDIFSINESDLQNFLSTIIVNTLNILQPVTSENEYAIRCKKFNSYNLN